MLLPVALALVSTSFDLPLSRTPKRIVLVPLCPRPTLTFCTRFFISTPLLRSFFNFPATRDHHPVTSPPAANPPTSLPVNLLPPCPLTPSCDPGVTPRPLLYLSTLQYGLLHGLQHRFILYHHGFFILIEILSTVGISYKIIVILFSDVDNIYLNGNGV